MRIDTVLLEMVGEGTKEELVENAALLDIEVVSDFLITPGSEVFRVVVDLPTELASRS